MEKLEKSVFEQASNNSEEILNKVLKDYCERFDINEAPTMEDLQNLT